MLRSWKLGKGFGIPLYIHSTFVLLPAWILVHAAFTLRGINPATALFLLAALAAVTACIVLHELGSALMPRAFGIRTRDITLYPIGGVARLERMSERPEEELCIALAGPAVNLVIAVLLAPVGLFSLLTGVLADDTIVLNFAQGPLVLAARFLTLVWLSNVLLVLFNLLPAFPMDGGRVFRALLSLGMGMRRATSVAATVGLVMAGLLGIGALWVGNPMLVVLALFVAFAGQQELLVMRRRETRRRASALEGAFPVRLREPALAPVPVPA